MKVLMLSWEFPPLIAGGLGMACYGLAKSMLELGHEVYLVLPTKKSVYFHFKNPHDVDELQPSFINDEEQTEFAKAIFPTLEDMLAYLGLSNAPETYLSPGMLADLDFNLDSLPDNETIERLKNALGSEEAIFRKVIEFAARMKQFVRYVDIDLVHAHDWLTFPAGWMVKYLTRKPFIAHIHATEFDRCGGPGNQHIHAIEYAGLFMADRVISVSNYTAQLIVSRYRIKPEKIRVIHNAFNINTSAPIQRFLKDPVILFLGRVTLQKGPDYFLEVAKQVLDKEPGIRFIMAGTGDMLRHIIHKSAYYKLATRFLFTGFLNRAQVEQMLAISDILIQPSVSEPFGIAPLEAMSFKVATIISKQSGVAEVVQNAYKIDFWDIDKMVEVLLELLNKPLRLKEIKEAGALEVKRIQWRDAAALLESVYKEIA